MRLYSLHTIGTVQTHPRPTLPIARRSSAQKPDLPYATRVGVWDHIAGTPVHIVCPLSPPSLSQRSAKSVPHAGQPMPQGIGGAGGKSIQGGRVGG